MAAPLQNPPTAVVFTGDLQELQRLYQILTGCGPPFRHSLKSLVLELDYRPGQSAKVDLTNEFLCFFPNLCDVELAGFHSLSASQTGRTPADQPWPPDPGVTVYRLRNLSVIPVILGPHSAQVLCHQLRNTPYLSFLELVGNHPADQPSGLEHVDAPLEMSYTLFHYVCEHIYVPRIRHCDTRCASEWAAPIVTPTRTYLPEILEISLCDVSDLAVLCDPQVDLSSVRDLRLSGPQGDLDEGEHDPRIPLAAYQPLILRCTHIRELRISGSLRQVLDLLQAGLYLSCPLFSIYVLIDEPMRKHDVLDLALSRALLLPHMLRLRWITVDVEPGTPSLPVLEAICDVRRVRLSTMLSET